MAIATLPTRRPIPEVLRDILGNLREIVQAEILLAKVEITEEAAEAAKAAATFGMGLVSGFYGIGLLLVAAVYGLSMIVAPWLAALLVGSLLAIVAMGLMSAGKKKLKRLNPARSKTIQRFEENLQWAKHQIK
jgi:putative superfamily III holin-X